jgi:hypothetical protein
MINIDIAHACPRCNTVFCSEKLTELLQGLRSDLEEDIKDAYTQSACPLCKLTRMVINAGNILVDFCFVEEDEE